MSGFITRRGGGSNLKIIQATSLPSKGKDGQLILLDADNIDKYIGKKVKIRSPLYCTTDKICSKCAGELYYRLEMKNLGLIGDRIASTIMQKSMKQFHDSTIKTTVIDYESHLERID